MKSVVFYAFLTLAVFVRPANSQPTVVPNDPMYAGQNQLLFEQLGLPELWAKLLPNLEPLPLLVMDTGVDCTHPDLAGNVDIASARSFVDSTPCFDEWGHGTGVAGIVNAKANNGQGVAGIAWNARIIPYKVMTSLLFQGQKVYWLGDNGDDTIVNALQAIAEMPDRLVIVNASLPLTWPSPRIHAALKALEHKAVIFAAAGNGVQNTEEINYLPCTASDLPNVVCVGAVVPDGRITFYSNYGNKVSLGAPINGLTTTAPGGQFNDYFSGTSSASPIAASIAVLAIGVLQAENLPVEKITPAMIKQAVIMGGTPDPSLNGEDRTAYFENPVVVSGPGTVAALKQLLQEK